MKKAALALLFGMALVPPAILEAQWARAYGVGRNDEAACIEQTPDGGFIVAGLTDAAHIWVAKLGVSGIIRWQKTVKTEALNGLFVQPTRDNGFILTGKASMGMVRPGLLAWRLDAKGQTHWQKYLLDPDQHYFTSQVGCAVGQTRDGGYVFTGSQAFRRESLAGSDTSDNLLVLKADSQGNRKWSFRFGGGGAEVGRSIRETPDGGFIVAGSTTSFGAGDEDAYVLKLKSDGSLAWSYAYGGPDLDQAHEVRRTSDGGYIVIGPTKSFGAGDYDLWLLKLGSQGQILWQKTYGGPKADYGHSVSPTPDGGCIVAGTTSSFGSGGFDGWILKLDRKGSIQWEKTYGGAGHDSLFAVRPLREGGYVAAGRTRSYGAGGSDILVVKVGKTGHIAAACGSFVGISRAIVLTSAGTSLKDPAGVAGGQVGSWTNFTLPLSDPKCEVRVICKK